MAKVLRKIKLNTNFKRVRVVMVMMFLVMTCAVAYAKTVRDEKTTARVKVETGYYAEAYFKATLTRTLGSTRTASCLGEATYTNALGNEVDYSNYDCALPYSVIQYTYEDTSVDTLNPPSMPIWESQPSKLSKCTKIYMARAYIWDSVHKERLCDTVKVMVEIS